MVLFLACRKCEIISPVAGGFTNDSNLRASFSISFKRLSSPSTSSLSFLVLFSSLLSSSHIFAFSAAQTTHSVACSLSQAAAFLLGFRRLLKWYVCRCLTIAGWSAEPKSSLHCATTSIGHLLRNALAVRYSLLWVVYPSCVRIFQLATWRVFLSASWMSTSVNEAFPTW